MRKTLLLVAFSLAISTSIAQNLKGKVYDNESTVKGVKVININTSANTFTDDNGAFSIRASVHDSLKFQSLFHQPKTIVVTQVHLNELTVFELKKIVNELDEVLLSEDLKEENIEVETYNLELQELLKEDMKQNPHLYVPTGSNNGVDFVYLIGQVIKLFKKKKSKVPEFVPITYAQISSLFSEHHFFNQKLLTEELKIPLKHRYLFFEFCEARQIDSQLLQKDKRFLLLDQFVICSKDFLSLLETYGDKK
ncbi:MAG: carboxypeptidase-like regulatory domain-containing protein [Bacteroidota bacterium]